MTPVLAVERQRVLNAFLTTGRAPEATPLWPDLARARWIVLDDHGSLRMAHPFSAVETDFVVEGSATRWFANCFWDALAVSAMVLQHNASPTVIHTHCGYSRQPMRVAIGLNGPPPGGELIHFAVPLRDWWADIVFT